MAFNEFETDSSKLFLRAVNVLLMCINEEPIETEDDIDKLVEAQIASDVLIETKKEVLSNGWDFNRDTNYSLAPDTDGYISIPYNILDVYSERDSDLIMRDWRLYSKKNQSAKFTEAQKVTVIWDMLFNSLTHPIRNYITIRASRKFQARQVMDTNMYGYTQEDEQSAYIIARRSDGRTTDHNMYTSQYGVGYLRDGR